MILNLLFPRRCIVCNRIGRYICLDCRKEIRYLGTQFCPVCRHPSLYGMAHPLCRNSGFLDGLYYSAHYWGPVKKAIRLMKYRYVSHLASELTGVLFKKFPPFLSSYDYFLPVPLHPKREKERGFNQSLLIARVFAKKIKLPIRSGVLLRSRYTKPQFGLKIRQRSLNVRNVFTVNNLSLVRNKKIILIDDVATTFSTLNECAQTLKKSGAASVFAVVLAHGN